MFSQVRRHIGWPQTWRDGLHTAEVTGPSPVAPTRRVWEREGKQRHLAWTSPQGGRGTRRGASPPLPGPGRGEVRARAAAGSPTEAGGEQDGAHWGAGWGSRPERQGLGQPARTAERAGGTLRVGARRRGPAWAGRWAGVVGLEWGYPLTAEESPLKTLVPMPSPTHQWSTPGL